MKHKLIILRGLPGSGKTTWAKQYIKENPNTIRVSRDDIRAMLTPKFKHGGKMEYLVSKIEMSSIKEAMNETYDIIVDATNFRGTAQFKIAADSMSYELEVKGFDTDLKTCIQRDQQRNNPVGKEVIERMYNKYLK